MVVVVVGRRRTGVVCRGRWRRDADAEARWRAARQVVQSMVVVVLETEPVAWMIPSRSFDDATMALEVRGWELRDATDGGGGGLMCFFLVLTLDS